MYEDTAKPGVANRLCGKSTCNFAFARLDCFLRVVWGEKTPQLDGVNANSLVWSLERFIMVLFKLQFLCYEMG